MSLLEDPEVKKTYDKCKYVVKIWEHKFTKKYRRIPSKLDIREAPLDVRHAYRKYFKLKSAALEESFMDVEGLEDEQEINDISSQRIESFTELGLLSQLQLSNDNFTEIVSEESEKNDSSFATSVEPVEQYSDNQAADDIWGSHLNRQKSPSDSTDASKENGLSKPVQSITKKLFCGSKFNKLKRNPRKSVSLTQRKNTESSFESPSFFSQPEKAFDSFRSEEALQRKNTEHSFESPSFFSQSEKAFGSFKSEEVLGCLEPGIKIPFLNKTVNPTESVKQVFSQPLSVSIIDTVLDQREKQVLRKVDTGWLERVAQTTGISLQNPELPQSKSRIINSSIPNLEKVETKVDYDSDEIIGDSDEEQTMSASISAFHIAKKSKLSIEPKLNSSITPTFRQPHNETLTNELSSITLKENITNNVPEVKSANKIAEKVMECITNDQQCQKYLSEDSVDKPKTLIIKENKPKKQLKVKNVKETQKMLKKRAVKKVVNSPNLNGLSSESPSLRRSTRKNKAKASFEELSSGEEDPFASDNDEHDPEFTPNELNTGKEKGNIFDFREIEEEFNKSIEEVFRTRKGRKKCNDEGTSTSGTGKRAPKSSRRGKNSEDDQNLDENYELEYNVKPRIVAPRFDNLRYVIKKKLEEYSKEECKSSKQPEDDQFLPKDKRQQAKEKLEKKIASGGLNDNFVTINLRKKVFARGKKGNNFLKHKRSQWKSKKKALYGPDMDMGGCDGGKLICFNCGQEGHFAQRCKAGKGDGLLPLTAEEAVEEECPFPTLEEATKMASESVLGIRNSKFGIAKGSSKVNSATRDKDADKDAGESNNEGFSSSDEEWSEDIQENVLLAEVEKLEEHVKKLDVQEYLDTIKVVKPYYDIREDGNVKETPQEVYEALEKFGHKSFRYGQEKAVMRILSGKSTLVTLSTGSGKSLCYQLPAYLYSEKEPCISLVISPLVSLMEDQVTGIPRFLKAACLHTNQTKPQRQKIMDAISAGELNVLLISPEAVVAGEKQTGFGSLFRKLPPIAFACIDEAHCVSQWSHNFRPSYLMICRVLRESLGVQTILGLTATATRTTCESIVKSLHISDGLEGIISDTPLPDNLCLTVSKDANRDRALLNLLLSDRFKSCKSIIVYCTRREECERIASFLRTSLKHETVMESTNKKRKRLNLQAEPYHAGLSASRRRTIQNAFMSGELRVVVATVAFGMGINKSDIRAVIHFNMPNSFESYVQEVGRAGRDGLPAHCHVFLDSQGRDENELRRHIHANSIDRHVIRKLLQKIFTSCACKGLCPKHEVAFSIEQTVRALDIPEENISTLLCYLELHEHKYIELLNPGYINCKVVSYGGPLQIRKAAKDCPPLAMALALYPRKEGEDNIVEFPVIEVASAMGWESGICKHKLKNLEWLTVNNQSKRSTLTVQFSNLGFRLLAPGNLSDEKLDEALDNLCNRVLSQETKALRQLHAVHKTLTGVAEKSYLSCISLGEDNAENSALKEKIREYFISSDPLANTDTGSSKAICEEQLISDIRAMICMYRDNQFTGRSLARIFHGIQSPNYPAVIWGRCKFWRSHLGEDFHEICRIATREIIRMR